MVESFSSHTLIDSLDSVSLSSISSGHRLRSRMCQSFLTEVNSSLSTVRLNLSGVFSPKQREIWSGVFRRSRRFLLW